MPLFWSIGYTKPKTKMMLKKYILTATALFFALATFPQNNSSARAMLDKAYAAYEASSGIRLSFQSMTLEPDGTEYISQTGIASIRGNKFKIETEAVDIWFDGETQWVLMKDVNEVNISNPTGQEIAAISPLALLGMYKNGYTLKAPLSRTLNGKNVQWIEMVPVTGNRDFKAVSVALDKSTYTLVQVILTMNNGMKNKIDITRYNANHQFDDAAFRFNKSNYPAVEMIDLR